MDHIAIDLGGRESQICVRSSDGMIIDECRVPTKRLARYLEKRAKSRVILEASAEAFAVADSALEAGHEVRVVPPTLARTLGVGSRRVKTDRKDAQALSDVSCKVDLPSVHVPSTTAREYRSMSAARESLVDARTQLVNSVRGYLRTRLGQIKTGGVESFTERARKALLKQPEGLPAFIERQLVVIESLNEQIGAAAEELEDVAAHDDRCRRLMTVPGVGPVTAVRFVAAVDQVERFDNAHNLESYLGLTPGEHSSSQKVRRTGITKAGPAKVRWALVQACWVLRRVRPKDPIVRWGDEVTKRRGKRVAIVAMARKLAGVLYAMWRDGTQYEPGRAAQLPEGEPA